jgi:hypothetical protein
MEWLNGAGGSTEVSGGSLPEQLRAWRQVAAEREQACEELEQINHWLEQENQRLQTALEQLRCQQRATAATTVRVETLPPTWKRCLAHYLRMALPGDSLRGRAIRKGYRLAARWLRRSA